MDSIFMLVHYLRKSLLEDAPRQQLLKTVRKALGQSGEG
jgi:hypothetical protein